MSRINRNNIDQFFEYDVNLETKTIYLGFGEEGSDVEIDSVLARRTIKSLHLLDRIRPDDPIHIILNSEGGDVQHGLAIYDSIRACQSPVHIHVTGHCYSMAAWILQAGDVRTMSKHSSLMIHDGDESAAGPVKVARNWGRFYKRQGEICFDLLYQKIREKNPTFRKTSLQKMLDTDTILLPQEALELGLIDEVVE